LLARSTEAAAAGPQLVAVAKNVYELRDGPALRLVPAQAAATATATATATAAVAVAVAVKELAPGNSLQGVRIEVSNGVGIRYLARRTAERLAPMGVVTARLTNQPRYRQSKTEIQFGAGQKEAAVALSMQLPVSVRTVASGGLAKNIQMRLVLGHDLIGNAIAAWLESGGETRVALAGHDGWRWS
jgi:LytR cell envelope-related transcriptional attenuator